MLTASDYPEGRRHLSICVFVIIQIHCVLYMRIYLKTTISGLNNYVFYCNQYVNYCSWILNYSLWNAMNVKLVNITIHSVCAQRSSCKAMRSTYHNIRPPQAGKWQRAQQKFAARERKPTHRIAQQNFARHARSNGSNNHAVRIRDIPVQVNLVLTWAWMGRVAELVEIRWWIY